MGVAAIGISKSGISKRGISKPGILASNTRYAYNMDGIDDRWTLANRAINPDGDNTFEFFTGGNTNSTIIAQNISATSTSREFQLYIGATPSLVIIFGGSITTLLTEAEGAKLNTKYFLNLTGSNYTVAEGISSNIIKNGAFIRGAAREPSAPTIIGARQNGAGSFAAYLAGLQRDIKINGTLWKMDQRNQAIQPSIPAGNNMTGANLNPDRWVEIIR